MATSGSINFTQTRNEIINDAFQLIGVYGIGRTISSEDMVFANSLLNKMVKAWQAQGLHLWSKEEAYLFIADNVGQYTLSNDSSSARACSRDDAVITQLNGDHTASDTTLVVDSTTGMNAADIIGIVLDDDTIHWTTIVSVDSSTALTITSGIASAAADNSNVYTFTSRINKPLRIHSMRRVSGVDVAGTSTRTEIEMQCLSHDEYFNLTTKTISGTPTCFYYTPDLSTGTLYMWPRPNDPNIYFEFTYERMLEDFDASTDNADFPTEWLECLTYQLAIRLAPAFGKDQKLQMLLPMASMMYDTMLEWDSEVNSIQFSPNRYY